MLLIPSDVKTPQLAMGADTPRPIKLKKASVKIASGTDNVKAATIGPAALGNKCRRNKSKEPALQERAAVM